MYYVCTRTVYANSVPWVSDPWVPVPRVPLGSTEYSVLHALANHYPTQQLW